MIGVLANFKDSGELSNISLPVLAVAKAFGSSIDILSWSQIQRAIVPEFISEVLVFSEIGGTGLAKSIAEVFNSRGYRVLLSANSNSSKEILGLVAGILDLPFLTDLVSVEPPIFKKYIYSGSVLATFKINSEKYILTLRSGSFSSLCAGNVEKSVTLVPSSNFDGDKIIGRRKSDSTRPELSTAKIVVTGGRALGSREAFEALIHPLADVLGGAIGATRAAVDNGFAPNDWQVGQTGKIVSPELYLAVGVSGAIQHIAGMKDSKFVACINKDRNAPIFEHCDIFLEADLFEAVPKIINLLKRD